jgi:hypothetical protein
MSRQAKDTLANSNSADVVSMALPAEGMLLLSHPKMETGKWLTGDAAA